MFRIEGNGDMTDSTQAAAALQTNVQRGLTGLERLRIAVDMSLFARRLAQARLHQEHPDWTDADVTKELLRAAFAPGELPRGLR